MTLLFLIVANSVGLHHPVSSGTYLCLWVFKRIRLKFCAIVSWCDHAASWLYLHEVQDVFDGFVNNSKQVSSLPSFLVRQAPICSNANGRWFAPRTRHSVRLTYRPSAALRLLGSLRISHEMFHVEWLIKRTTLLYFTAVDCGTPDPMPHSNRGTWQALHSCTWQTTPAILAFALKAEEGQSNFSDCFLLQQCVANGNWTPEILERTKCQGKDMIRRCK